MNAGVVWNGFGPISITILSMDPHTVQLGARVLGIGHVIEQIKEPSELLVCITMGCQLTGPRYLFFQSPLLEPKYLSPLLEPKYLSPLSHRQPRSCQVFPGGLCRR